MSTLLLMTAALGLIAGAALMAWSGLAPRSVSAEPVEARLSVSTRPLRLPACGSRSGQASTSSGLTGEELDPATYRRRILGAMIVGASLFLGGFTLAWRIAA